MRKDIRHTFFSFVDEWVDPRSLYHKIRIRWERSKHGFASNSIDTWSMSESLSEQIYQQLKQFKKENVHSYSGESNEEWQVLLDEMIDGFDKMRRWDEITYQIMKKHIGEKMPSDALKKEIESYRKEVKREDKKMKKQCKLFIDNFLSLWD
jgi:uncharacterized membrane-anchored protein YjiN (DUF445 family)